MVKEESKGRKSLAANSKFAPKNNADWIKRLSHKGIITEDKANELTRHKPVPGAHGLGKGTAPLAEISRPGHFDHTSPSLRPNFRADPTTRDPEELREQASPVDNISLQRSSSSLLAEEERLLREDHDEEVGKLGCQFYCIKQHKYRTSKVLRTKEEANLFATVITLLIIVWYLPTLALQAVYFFVKEVRERMVRPEEDWELDKEYVLMILLILISFIYGGLIYFSGVARRHPYHLILIAAKSTTWAVLMLLITALTEHYFITLSCVKTHNDFHKYEDDVIKVNELFMACLELKHGDGHHKNSPVFAYFTGILLGMIYFFIYFLLAWCSKFSFFGPHYPFMSYTVSWIVATTSSTMMLKNLFHFNHSQIPYNIIQCIAATVIATTMTQMFVSYITRLIQGQLCPLQPKEFFYAAAHY